MTGDSPGGIGAAMRGLLLALGAPGLLLGTLLVSMIAAAPFALVIEQPVMQSLVMQPPVAPIAASEIDPEWWLEFRRHAGGLAATFTPAILGFAAPLESVSALLDGTRRPMALVVPVAVSAIVWAFLWGGILHRFATGIASAGAFMRAGARHFPHLAAISATAAAANLAIYLTLHPVLFSLVYGAIASRLSTERDAFITRVVLYAVFGVVLLLVNAVFSFARVYVATHGERSVTAALARGVTFVRSRAAAVIAQYAVFLLLFAAAMAAYGAAELAGGSRVGGWRAVAIGQAFILVRLGLRLALGASQVQLASARIR